MGNMKHNLPANKVQKMELQLGKNVTAQSRYGWIKEDFHSYQKPLHTDIIALHTPFLYRTV